MKRAAMILAGLWMFGAAAAAEPPAADPGIYGPIDTAKFPKPQVVNRKPVLADTARLPKGTKRSAAPALYLHIPFRHIAHWQAHCATYNACSVPVHFVTETWFLNVYLPAIGAMDGREQRYREQMGRDRELQREYHDEDGDE